jgi:hypothetical protein
MQDFFTNFLLLENFAKYCLDPEPEPKLFQSPNRNHNKSIRFHNTVKKRKKLDLKTQKSREI